LALLKVGCILLNLQTDIDISFQDHSLLGGSQPIEDTSHRNPYSRSFSV
jgi:hypothetical protein